MSASRTLSNNHAGCEIQEIKIYTSLLANSIDLSPQSEIIQTLMENYIHSTTTSWKSNTTQQNGEQHLLPFPVLIA